MDEVLIAVADPTRRGILLLTRDREVAAGEIAAQFPMISRPAVSQHLRAEGFAEAADFLDTMWAARLDHLKREVEKEHQG
jgi:DNA-binding transcriptional ArsR family regulator